MSEIQAARNAGLRRRGVVITVVLAGALLAAIAFSTWFHARVGVLPFDDAFITYRYAENLLAGRGLVYNAGERVFGASTPLYILWLSILKALTGVSSLPLLAVRWNALWFALTALGMTVCVARVCSSARWGVLAGVYCSLSLPLLSISSGGMESALFSALLVWAVWGSLTGRYRLAALLGGLSAVARPEGILLCALVGLHWLLSERAKAVWFWGLLILPGLVWAAFAFWYFGSPVPQSVVVKSLPLYPLPAGDALRRLLYMFGSTLTLSPPESHVLLNVPPIAGVVGATAAVAAGALGVWLMVRNARTGLWLVPAIFLTLLALYALGNPLILEWYLQPVFVAGFLMLFSSPGLLSRSGERNAGSARRPLADRLVRAAANLLLVALICSLIYQYGVLAMARRGPVEVVQYPSRLRIASYERAAAWLTDQVGEFAVVAAPEIGALGYYWQGEILDVCGLVSKVALSHLPVPSLERVRPDIGAVSTSLIQSERPDFVVTLPVFVERSLLMDPWFAREYRLVTRFPLPLPVWESEDVLVFQRANASP